MKRVHGREHMGGQQPNNKENKLKHAQMTLEIFLNSSEKLVNVEGIHKSVHVPYGRDLKPQENTHNKIP